jgi:pyridoxine 5-phosphate synthase
MVNKPRRLGVNIDHVATVRQARRSPYPDPVAAALVAELAGADQITCHIRGDRRHIVDSDLPRLRDAVQTLLNVEMAATDEMLHIAETVLGQQASGGRVHQITLVAERPGEVTTEGGLDVAGQAATLGPACRRLVEAGLRVAVFIDPEEAQVQAAFDLGVPTIELNTARYAEGHPGELARLGRAARLAQGLGLELAAGHGLTHHNLGALVAAVPEIIEYNIGHSIIGRAIFIGLDAAVRDIATLIRR